MPCKREVLGNPYVDKPPLARQNASMRAPSTLPVDTPQDQPVVVRRLGLVDYASTWQAMQDFTSRRSADAMDEIWLLQHPPVYTLGLNAKTEPFINPNRIPLVQTDRGGDITYHGPGQWVVYVLMDLRRRGWGVKSLVSALEQAIIDLLQAEGILAERRPGAPGIYVTGRKIAQLGLRVRRGASYHGLSLNVDMDLTPFQGINPCGYVGLESTQLRQLLPTDQALDFADVGERLLSTLTGNLRYNRLINGATT